MLTGLAAAAIPVAVHLLSRRGHVDVNWAAMRFLRAAEAAARRRLRVEDLLLLAGRAAVLALLAIAAAGPTLGRASVDAGAVTAVVVIDDSASMTGTDGVASRFDRAKAAADRLIAGLPVGSTVAVLIASDVVAPLVASPTHDLPLARRLIAAAPVTDRASDLRPALRAAVDLLRPLGGARQLTVITDGQRSAWGPLDDATEILRSAPDVSARVVVVGPDVTQDVGLSDLRPGGDLIAAGHPVRFDATVTNYGTDAVRDLPVRLTIDGTAAADATVPELPAAAARVVPLYARLPTPGPHAVAAAVPADHLPADDRRAIIVRAAGHLSVLLVDCDPSEHVDRSAAAFLRAALLPVPADHRADYVLGVTTVPPSALAGAHLAGYAAVVFAGSPPVDGATADALLAYVAGGGGLIVFPDGPLELPGLFPAAVGPVVDGPRSLSAGPFDHPIAAAWNDAGAASLAAVQVTRSAPLRSMPGTSQVVLRFADGAPFAVERPVGRGRSILFAIAADTAASDLPDRGGVFVPLLYRCLASIVNRGDEPLNVSVGRPLVGPAALSDVGHTVTLATPAGPADTTVTLTGDAAGFRYDATDRAGPYAATVGGTRMLFAAGVDPAESNLDRLTDADRATLSTVATVGDGSARAAGTGGGAAVPLLLAALALAVVEPFLANGVSRPR